ncbi:MAG: type II secretion system F family protein [Candidatus Omnitrophota bacterium]|nr:type II secretion system F family protein [Candidatus Omnitrophota bacterium]
MAQFAYQARNRTGKLEQGTLEASSSDEAVSILQTRDLLVVTIKEQRGSGPVLSVKTKRMHNGVTSSDLVIFSRSLSAMTEAGLPLLRSMETAQGQIRSRKLSAALVIMIQDIRGGSTFRDAMAKHLTIFSPFWISLVETGEASGQLTKALEQIAIYLEKSGAIQRKVVSALMYPAVLGLVSVGAILVFTLKIIPTFATMFASFGAQLPLLTRLVIAFSNTLRHFFPLIVLGIVGAWFLITNYLKTKQGRWQFDKLRLQAPIFGPVFQGVATEQFSSNLGTLLKAGVPILHALDIVITTCDNKVIAAVIENMKAGVREGRPLAEPLEQTDLFPPMVAQMLAVGEQTGKLPDMLAEISHYYEEQVTTAVERMTTLLEPIMLVGMGAIIGVLVISMYLPIFELTSVIKG